MSPKTLREIQDSFQRAILEGDDGFLDDLVDSPREKRDILLGVYCNAYVLRLVEILQHDYENLHAYLGDDQFDALARAYVAACPSRNFNGRWFGARMSEFLAGAAPYAARPELSELAAFEWALLDVFDAEDCLPLEIADLTIVPPTDWPRLIFQPRPSVRRLDMATNALAIWQALDDEEEIPEAARLPELERIIIYRPEWGAMFRIMGEEEAIMWNEAVKGIPFGALCEIVAMYGGEEEAAIRGAGYLKGWLDARLLAKA
jgi:hypothetical protein